MTCVGFAVYSYAIPHVAYSFTVRNCTHRLEERVTCRIPIHTTFQLSVARSLQLHCSDREIGEYNTHLHMQRRQHKQRIARNYKGPPQQISMIHVLGRTS